MVRWWRLFLPRAEANVMTTAEKISIALPPEMVAIVRGAVATWRLGVRS